MAIHKTTTSTRPLSTLSLGIYHDVAWDYRLSEHWDSIYWRFPGAVHVEPRGGHSLKGSYSRIVKKNQWYTYRSRFRLNPSRPKLPNPTNVTLVVAYRKCDYCGGNGLQGDVQIDNVRVHLS